MVSVTITFFHNALYNPAFPAILSFLFRFQTAFGEGKKAIAFGLIKNVSPKRGSSAGLAKETSPSSSQNIYLPPVNSTSVKPLFIPSSTSIESGGVSPEIVSVLLPRISIN